MRLMTIGVLVVIFLFLFMIFFSVMWQPFATEITQDKPIVKKLCEWQAGCKSVKGPFMCSDDPNHDNYQRLNRWRGFRGCNNLTAGYDNDLTSGTHEGYVNVEVCSCGGLM